jgi:hypothetical protein
MDDELNSVSSSFWSKSWKDKIIIVAVSAMAIGQWADTKNMAEAIYVGVFSNFTHKYEYENLNRVNVGANLTYVEQTLGSPQLIKKSKYVDNIKFNYYLNKKYILTLIHKENRVIGYSILSLVEDFVPYDLITKNEIKNKRIVSQFYTEISDFTVDYNNIKFILTQEELDKNNLFLNKFSGSIGYLNYLNLDSAELKQLYDALNNESSDYDVEKEIEQITSKTINNFYGVGEINLSVIADSILTDFEYSLYYQKI